MSILDTNVVDVIGIDAPNGIARLGISDHLRWDEAEHDHLVLLQDKINTYLMYLESGQVYENNPNTKGCKFEIELVAKYELSPGALDFFKQAQTIVRDAGFELTWRVPPAAKH
ncbi:DUF6572 domain-containing protein [Paraburkholderia sacchari]|uniref:DUF6572 domain-containing protein n=1 Tax=Paraburkholderia sacchari TaxID=159450 RepID=UPI000541A8CA|nr:DUF6572 domain-containing protein [Paraburkholderia sacchari]NLP65386.1 hypothetical protein [Paraburkholderia sacchari]